MLKVQVRAAADNELRMLLKTIGAPTRSWLPRPGPGRRGSQCLSQLSHGLTGRCRTTAPMPDIWQDADLRIRIPVHWPDARHWSTDQMMALHCLPLARGVRFPRPGPRGLLAHAPGRLGGAHRVHRRTLRHAGTSWPAGVHPGLVRRGLLRLGGVGGRPRTRTVRGAGKAATAPRPPPPGGRLRRRLPGSPSPGPQAWTPRLGRCPKGMCAPARASRQRRSGSHQVAQWPPS